MKTYIYIYIYIYIYTHTIFPIPYANYQGPDIVEVVALASPPPHIFQLSSTAASGDLGSARGLGEGFQVYRVDPR